jgi:hypothetical protein
VHIVYKSFKITYIFNLMNVRAATYLDEHLEKTRVSKLLYNIYYEQRFMLY